MVKKQTILIIDDNFVNAELLKAYLSKTFEVIHQPDPVQWYESVMEHNPSVVLLDLIMPRKSGYEVYEELKKNPKTNQIPVIILTAYYNIRDVAKELGGLPLNNVFPKPFRYPQLRDRIDQVALQT